MSGLPGDVMSQARSQARRSLPRLAVVGVLVALAVAAAQRWSAPTRPWLAGAVFGVGVTGYLWWAVWVVWVSSGVAERLQAATAQERSVATLRRLGPHTGWHVLANVPVAAEVADVVLVSPAAVVAVTTKWSVRPWVSDDVSRACERAAIAAAGVERLVQQVDPRLPVHAAIVVWGPAAAGLGRRQVPMGRHLVDVVPGQELADWARPLRHGDVPPDVARHLAVTLSQHTEASTLR